VADFELKNYKEAASTFDALKAEDARYLNSTPVLLYVAAKSYEARGECRKAVNHYRALLPMISSGVNYEEWSHPRLEPRGRRATPRWAPNPISRCASFRYSKIQRLLNGLAQDSLANLNMPGMLRCRFSA
jgi:hypothetical protein